MEKGHYGQYTGNHPKFSKKKDESYDANKAYDKNLSASARLHYLENDRADHKSPVNGNAFTKAMADSGGDYNEAKQALDSPATNYGTPLENSGLGPKTADSGIYNTDELRGERQQSSIHNFLSQKKQERINSENVSAETSSNIDEKLKTNRPGTGSNTSTSDSKTTATVPNNVSQSASSGQSSRNLSRKIGKKAKTELKLKNAKPGSRQEARATAKLAKTNDQIGNLQSKIKNDKKPKGSGGSGGSGGSSAKGGSGGSSGNNINTQNVNVYR